MLFKPARSRKARARRSPAGKSARIISQCKFTGASKDPPPIPRASGIYFIVCKATGRFYVGSAVNLHERRRSHWTALRGESAETNTCSERGADTARQILNSRWWNLSGRHGSSRLSNPGWTRPIALIPVSASIFYRAPYRARAPPCSLGKDSSTRAAGR